VLTVIEAVMSVSVYVVDVVVDVEAEAVTS
jgi:hypothetical protein